MAELVDCVIPAAGRSVRMGRWKPVLPFGDSTIIQTVVSTALQTCSRVVLVTGYRGAELAVLFKGDPRVIRVENASWELGMFGSIRMGAAAVKTRRFFVTLGDMPWISSAVYNALLCHEEAEVLFPEHDGTRGHPVLFHERVRDAIASADSVEGSMRAVAASFRVSELHWTDDSILRDADTEQDLR
ncbi:MAG: NTP transferase domain-containing protein [Spirochaetia bacterium]